MCKNYTFLFAPLDAVGHVNACTGIAEQLRDRGHRVVFATPITWKGKLAVKGFEEELFRNFDESAEEAKADMWAHFVARYSTVISRPSIELHRNMQIEITAEMFKQMKYSHERLKEIVQTVNPDVIVVDYMFRLPSLMDQGIPWVLSASVNPLGISNVNVPPAFSGYATDGDRNLWKRFDDEVDDVYEDFLNEYKQWVVEAGGPEMEMKYPFNLDYSPYANIYMYPIELDYTHLRPMPKNWHRFDAFVRTSDEEFQIPEKLKDGPGKLIYFSMGTIGSADVSLMKKLIAILAKSPNRFIVSKGPRGDEFDLAENMYGEISVPQVKVIPMVDLVITHGGNNTITESFYFGKRVLVLSLLWDQLDNGQRIHETGLGMHLSPFKLTEPELLESIEKLLANELLERRMSTISKRIQSSNSQAKAADLIQTVAANNRIRK